MADFLPSKDNDLLAWSANFNTRITATPTAFGLTAGIATAYAAAHTAFASALATAVNPSTRTPVTVAAKDAAKAALKLLARQDAAIVQATVTVTPSQKTDLGITPRDRTRTPIPTPSTRPVITIERTSGGTYVTRIIDETTVVGRKRPFGYLGAIVGYKVGDTAPANFEACAPLGASTRVPSSFDLSDVAVGAKVWLVARWYNARGELGPESAAVAQVRAA